MKGETGISYEAISSKIDSKGQSKEKLQSYLTSHYCRKLYKLSLIEIKNQRKKSNTVLERVVTARDFANPREENLLKRRTPEEFQEDQSDSDNSLGENSVIQTIRSKNSLNSIDFYDPEKSFEANFMELMLMDANSRHEGFLIKEIR